MHRPLQAFLPIVLIALAMQVVAPIAACWAAAIAGAEPPQSAAICHDNGASSIGQNDQTGVPGAHVGSCSICCLAQANASFDGPQATFSMPFRQAQHVVWHDEVANVRSSRAGSNSQARAPPQLT